MGETGCGKTRLIRYMCGLQAGHKGPRNMLLVKVSWLLEFDPFYRRCPETKFSLVGARWEQRTLYQITNKKCGFKAVRSAPGDGSCSDGDEGGGAPPTCEFIGGDVEVLPLSLFRVLFANRFIMMVMAVVSVGI